jgi:SAM-dependent methyltransferase
VCISCGHIQLTRLPSQKEIEHYYVGYSDKRATFVGPSYFEIMKKRAQAQFSFILKHAEITDLMPVLDVGCGYGKFLELIKRKRFKGRGLEFDDLAITHAKNMGLEVSKISSESEIKSYLPKDGFVFLSHVLEHLLDLDVLLKEIAENSKLCFIEVPTYSPYLDTQFVDQEGHINFFNKMSLQKLLSTHFEIIKIQSCGPSLEEFYSNSFYHNIKNKIHRRLSRDFFMNKSETENKNGMWVRAIVKRRNI